MIATEATCPIPEAPRTLEESGVSEDLVLQIVTKTLHFAGQLTGIELASRLGVAFRVIEPSLDFLKRERHCELSNGSVLGAPAYRYRLTDAGRARAALFAEQNQYVGRVPVPIEQYRTYMQSFAREAATTVSRDAVRRAFSHLVLSSKVLDQLGPAIASGHSLFIYGPPGNGKTVISQAIRNLLGGQVAVPYALSVEGHVIRVFDPVNHEPVKMPPPSLSIERESNADGRWVACRRPLVTAGGELTLDALELGFSSTTGFYTAPLQTIANGGVLVVDDFGRQHASPRDMLNRWIVPLESRVDYLTLQTGQKIELPFLTLVVFATNIKPAELVDEAFLRRIQYKVLAESPTEAEFIDIFHNCCRERALEFDPAIVDGLLATELRPRGIKLRGCQPRDLIDHALSLAAYLGEPRALTLELLEAACATYFVDETAASD
jgi:hypothetical protein